MKRISYWALSTLSACVLLYGFDASQRGGTGTTATTPISGGVSGTTSGGSTDGSGNNGSSSSGTNRSGSSGTNRSGTDGSGPRSSAAKTVTGSVISTQWGPVQVQLTVGNGSITKVTMLQYPNGNSRDVEIANYSLPILIQETIKSQSANIDMVSGATYTSDGYVRSLQSALDQANL